MRKEREDNNMHEQVISVRNLTKSFGQRTVVKGLSFDVQAGQVFGLLGHNGAGKSTTIDILLGLKQPDEGEAYILGMKASENRKHVFTHIGVQLQSTGYHPTMRVDEVCREYAALYEHPADYRELLAQFHLNHVVHSTITKLSGGEKQKLSVVLALIGNPQIVFLDELTTGLDVVSRREVWKTLLKLKQTGLTVLLTTHYMEEAEALCDRLCLIRNGTKAAEGTVQEIIALSGKSNLEEAYLYYMEQEDLSV
ncbi:MAG: ABC transporter ATP-binding protein [Bulleidia sp.]